MFIRKCCMYSKLLIADRRSGLQKIANMIEKGLPKIFSGFRKSLPFEIYYSPVTHCALFHNGSKFSSNCWNFVNLTLK